MQELQLNSSALNRCSLQRAGNVHLPTFTFFAPIPLYKRTKKTYTEDRTNVKRQKASATGRNPAKSAKTKTQMHSISLSVSFFCENAKFYQRFIFFIFLISSSQVSLFCGLLHFPFVGKHSCRDFEEDSISLLVFNMHPTICRNCSSEKMSLESNKYRE